MDNDVRLGVYDVSEWKDWLSQDQTKLYMAHLRHAIDEFNRLESITTISRPMDDIGKEVMKKSWTRYGMRWAHDCVDNHIQSVEQERAKEAGYE